MLTREKAPKRGSFDYLLETPPPPPERGGGSPRVRIEIEIVDRRAVPSRGRSWLGTLTLALLVAALLATVGCAPQPQAWTPLLAGGQCPPGKHSAPANDSVWNGGRVIDACFPNKQPVDALGRPAQPFSAGGIGIPHYADWRVEKEQARLRANDPRFACSALGFQQVDEAAFLSDGQVLCLRH